MMNLSKIGLIFFFCLCLSFITVDGQIRPKLHRLRRSTDLNEKVDVTITDAKEPVASAPNGQNKRVKTRLSNFLNRNTEIKVTNRQRRQSNFFDVLNFNVCSSVFGGSICDNRNTEKDDFKKANIESLNSEISTESKSSDDSKEEPVVSEEPLESNSTWFTLNFKDIAKGIERLSSKEFQEPIKKELDSRFKRINTELVPKIRSITEDFINDLHNSAKSLINEFASKQAPRLKRATDNNRWSDGILQNFFNKIANSVKDYHTSHDLTDMHAMNNFYRSK